MLTPLERKIKAAALWHIRKIDEMPVSNSKWIVTLSLADWDASFDRVYYDNENKKWDHIEYDVWKGKKIIQKTIPL